MTLILLITLNPDNTIMEKRFSEMTQEERLQLFEAERRLLDPLVEKYKK